MRSCFIVRKYISLNALNVLLYVIYCGTTWCVGTIVNIYLVEEKKCALLIVLVKVKKFYPVVH